MRLHHLEVTAFGPFAETVRVDFDALSDAGLFLLTGPTGAGKTSVLDAVCFALYGEVPGDRQAARRLRCDQAPAGVAPRVVLEVTLTGRRFRLDRSPAWERPKKRGTGTTAQQASVRLLERVDGEWVPLSQRLDETGQMVSRLVGLTMTQFCQVALLPQGRFQAFLRARSEDRQRLLQQLFRTARFEAVERWLRDRRRELRQASAAHHDEVADLVSRTSEAAGVALPEAWDVTDLAAPAGSGELAAWSAQQLGTAEEAVAAAALRVDHATSHETAARSALDAGREVVRLQAARQQALTEQARLREQEPSHRDDRRRLADARRAAGVLPLHAQATDLADAAARAAERRESLVASVAAHGQADPADLDTAALEAMEVALRDRAAAARALAPREATLADLERRIPATERDIEAWEGELAEVDAQLAALPARRQRLHEELAEARQAGDLLPAAVRRVATLRDRSRAAEEAATLEAELVTARDGLTSAVETLLDVKETWLQVQQQRLEGMAAELAGGLAVGADCPVCGSHEHPRPAVSRPGAPDAAAEKAARRRVDDAETTRLLHEERVRDLQARIAGARERAAGEGDPAAELPVAEAEVNRLEKLHARAAGLAEEAGKVEEGLERLGTGRDGLLAKLAGARAEVESLRRESLAIAAQLEAALADSDAVTLTDLAADLDILATGCRAALLAEAEATRAAAAATEASERLAAALAAGGFESVGSLLEAALDGRSVAALETRVRDHEQAVARVAGVLESPDVRAVEDAEPPDLEALAADHERACEAVAEASAAASLARVRATRLASLAADLRDALERWGPVRHDLVTATHLAALTDGSSADNRLRMRLSAYVLAWRLSQVVAAANVRLAGMTGQRYTLEHTGRRGTGETRGGLSLLVRDEWSGEARDPATLSGGETFVVSLALALGLADVVAHEAGGADLDTLFVDEGFGSLDAETLDDVMDTLDSLRDGGRVVGVVSHVAEMRDRIPVQLQVSKARTGSRLAVSR